MKVFENEMSRTDLARWLRDLAAQLEAGSDLVLTSPQAPGHLAVADQITREVEIEQSTDGSEVKLEIEISWTGADVAEAQTLL